MHMSFCFVCVADGKVRVGFGSDGILLSGSEFPSARVCIPALKTENGMHISAKTTSARYRPGEGHCRDVR